MILELIINSKEYLNSSEISKILGIPSSTTHDILKTLEGENILCFKDDVNKTYDIGVRLIRFASLYISNDTIINIAKNQIKEVAEKYGIASFILQRKEKLMYVTYAYESDKSILKLPNIGTKFDYIELKRDEIRFEYIENQVEILSVSVPFFDYCDKMLGIVCFFGFKNNLEDIKMEIKGDLLKIGKYISKEIGQENIN